MNNKEQVLEVLRTARDVVLADENSWCQGSYAETSTGADVTADHEDAVSFCRVGAMSRAAHLLGLGMTRGFSVGRRVFGKHAETVNDDPDTTYSSTIDDFDRAIKKLEES